jgi:glyoxylate reductase
MSKPVIYQVLRLPDYVQEWVDAECEAIPYQGSGPATRDDLAENLPKAVGLLVSNQLPVDNDLIAANPQLRVISILGVGYDRVDVPFATEHGVLVCNTPVASTDAVADLTLGLIIAVDRHIMPAHEHVRFGAWAKGVRLASGVDLRGKTLGILGLGRIGHAVARRAVPFGMEVIYYDPVRSQAAEGSALARYAERDEVIRSADFLTLHLTLDVMTRRGFGRRELELMKPSAFLINASRGGAIDQDALIAALQAKRIAGAGLDVFEAEPLPADSPLLRLDNVLLTPHMAGSTAEAQRRYVEDAARNIVAAVNGRVSEATPVNPEALAVREQVKA